MISYSDVAIECVVLGVFIEEKKPHQSLVNGTEIVNRENVLDLNQWLPFILQ